MAKRKQRLYYADLEHNCCLWPAYTLQSARRAMHHEHGTLRVRHVRRATQADIDWVLAMGGIVPKNCLVDRG